MKTVAPAVFFALFILGCPKRIAYGPEGQIKNAQALLSLVRSAAQQRVSVKGSASLDVSGVQQSGRVTLFIAAQRPAHLHIEALDFFGSPLAVLVVNGDRFGVFQKSEGRYYRGPATPENIARFSPVPLGAGELLDVLLGAPPLPDSAERLSEEGTAYVLQAGPWTLRIDPSSHQVLEARQGDRSYAFSDFRGDGASRFAWGIEMNAANGSSARVHYTDAELNGQLEEGLFKIEPPPGVQVIELDAKGLSPGS